MGNRGIGRLKRLSRRLWHLFQPKVLILLYHRITELSQDPHLLSVTPEHFAEHLEILKKKARPLSLQEMRKVLQGGDLPRRAVVVTFDDGYADNLYNAKPLLERYEIPATVFITAGYLENLSEFWWDELERILLQPETLPKRLSLSLNGEILYYDLEKDDTPSRYGLYRSLYQRMHPLPDRERQKGLSQLRQWAHLPLSIRPTHRPLSSDELIRLARGEMIEIGAHSLTHPVLSHLSKEEQEEEIGRSRSQLETLLGSSITSFAYPYGNHSDYNSDTLTLVQKAGFRCACSNFGDDLVRRETDPFQLPRVIVKNWDGNEFTHYLPKEWLYA